MLPTPAHIDIEKIREQFPVLNRKINGYPLVYFDNAASSQKPLRVIERISEYYKNEHANIHRGVHSLSQQATNTYEEARKKTAHFIGARESAEILFTRGTTESINLVAATYGEQNLKPGDEVLISYMEHHSNMVPWQMLCSKTGATLKAIDITPAGELDMADFEKKLSSKTKIVAIGHVSNTLGTINPVKDIIDKAHQAGAVVLIDGAQAAPHLTIDVQKLDCDFYAASGHKMYGPTGIGFLYGKRALLENMPPYHGGGEMIGTVDIDRFTCADLPFKFEAGTPNIAGGIALGEAIDFIRETGIENIAAQENALLEYATGKMRDINGMRFIGEAGEKAGVISFLVSNIHPYDLGVLLDQMGVAVRTGHHCTDPLMKKFGIPGTVRASFAVYNTHEEVDRFINALQRAVKILG